MSPWTPEIRLLHPAHEAAVRLHWLSLGPEDRYQRFGMRLSDEALWRWAQALRWTQHHWWGAWLPTAVPAGPVLAGVLQLTPTTTPACWELALSVQTPVRRLGIATRLLQTALAETPVWRQLICHHGHVAIQAMAQTLDLQVLRALDGSLRLSRPCDPTDSEVQHHPATRSRCILRPFRG